MTQIRSDVFGICALALLAAASPGLAQTQASPAPPRYPFRSAVITYELTGVKSGTKTVTIKGAKEAIEEKGVQLGNEFHVLYLSDGENFFVINLLTQEGSKVRVTPEMRKQMEQGGLPSMTVLGQNVTEQMKKEVGKDRVLDRECSVRDILGQRVCVWADSVPLKTDGNVMGIQIREIATKIEENVEIPESRFEVPAGVKLRELSSPAAPAGPTPTAAPTPAATSQPAGKAPAGQKSGRAPDGAGTQPTPAGKKH